MKITKIHIEKYKVFENFDIDFTNKGKSQNLVVIAGINGCGKTTLLKDVLYDFLSKKIIHDGIMITLEYFDSETKQIQDEQLDRNKLIDSFDYNTIRYKDYNFPNVYFFQAGYSNPIQAKESILKFVDKLIYQNDLKSSEAYEEVQKILCDLFVDFELQIDFDGVNQNREIFFKNKKNEKIRIDELSSGEQELITKSFTLYLSDLKDSIILVDEPESSMHPNWQNRIASIYQKIANEKNNQIFIATHSPHIIASVNKEQIRVLIKEHENIKAIQDFSGSYGWRVDKILLEIFRLSSLRTPFIENELSRLKELVFKNEFEVEEFHQKFDYLEKVLGYEDIDLSMLRLEIFKRKKQNAKNK